MLRPLMHESVANGIRFAAANARPTNALLLKWARFVKTSRLRITSAHFLQRVRSRVFAFLALHSERVRVAKSASLLARYRPPLSCDVPPPPAPSYRPTRGIANCRGTYHKHHSCDRPH